MAEDGISVGACSLVAEYIAAVQVFGVLAPAQRFDEVGKTRARDGVLLQMPGELAGDGSHDSLGGCRRHIERRCEIGHGRPALHVPQGIVHLHATRPPPVLHLRRRDAMPPAPLFWVATINTGLRRGGKRKAPAAVRQNGFQVALGVKRM